MTTRVKANMIDYYLHIIMTKIQFLHWDNHVRYSHDVDTIMT